MSTRIVFLLALLICGVANADNYDVQIGAFKNPDSAKIELPPTAGDLRTTTGADGLTRFLVGPFANRGDANRVRDQLRAAGFDGAFVRAAGANTTLAERDAVYTPPTASDTPAYADDGQGELVYLDGKLHRKVGGRFIRVEE